MDKKEIIPKAKHIKEVLTDEEYYKLDKEAKWPSNINAPDCIDDIENDIVDFSD